jgi:endonuclease/exonuclease/phosphatase family metal-dependent hydrolase
MILVTWNCCRGPYPKKLALLQSLNADIAVLQECPRPPAESDHCVWFGDNPRQGIAIIAKPPYSLTRLPTRRAVPKFIVPVAVTGPRSFSMLAVWSKARQKHNYVEAVVKAVRIYRELLAAGPAVVLGDFNSNTIWDKSHLADRNHSALVKMLGSMNLVSAYHAHFNEAHGAETRPTYYFQWKERQPFHLDYCFVPAGWIRPGTRVQVARYEEWKQHSDHRPLIVELPKEMA